MISVGVYKKYLPVAARYDNMKTVPDLGSGRRAGMKEEGGVWRHELKFICTMPQMKIVESRIKPLLKPDPHAGKNGMYSIRSVYFDDEWDTCYCENADGTDPREKFRIRIYDGSDGRITLELKQKLRGMTRKLSCPLSREQCSAALRGELPEGWADAAPVLRKFAAEQRDRNLSAKCIVEYDRTPYIYRPGNVRITLDENIRSSHQAERFLMGDFIRRPVMAAGEHVLEVKYDDFLPDPIRQVLQLDTLRRTSFSKYYICRHYSAAG